MGSGIDGGGGGDIAGWCGGSGGGGCGDGGCGGKVLVLVVFCKGGSCNRCIRAIVKAVMNVVVCGC